MRLLSATAAAVSLLAAAPRSAAEPSAATEVARGSYLANGIARCFWCHSPLDRRDPARPIPAKLGSGDILDEKARVFGPNLTPDHATGLGTWSDAEIVRAIRGGVGRDGRPLRDHPATYYSAMTDADVSALVAYLRSLRPIRRALPRSAIDDSPRSPVQPGTPPSKENEIETPLQRGRYLVQLGECLGCHTPPPRPGVSRESLQFGGGRAFFVEKGVGIELAGTAPPGAAVVTSANLTPDATGIPYYTEKVFVQTIRTGRVAGVRPLSAAMPWIFFRTMTDADLAAIFTYLRSLPPIRHAVSNTDPPVACARCGGVHGLGEYNAVASAR
jgi:Cytochrome c